MTDDLSTSVALCWVLPFLRLTGIDPREVAAFQRAGVGLLDFASASARLSRAHARELLDDVRAWSSDPHLALHAGEQHIAGDLGTVELAARSCATLRDALLCVDRHVTLLHEGVRTDLAQDAQRAVWYLRSSEPGVHAAANEFALATAYTLICRYARWQGGLREVHFTHPAPLDCREHARVFDGAELKFVRPTNALVFAVEHLDAPMVHAHAGFVQAHELRADMMERERERMGSATARTRRAALELLKQGDASMPAVARKLRMSTATLRRRLHQEATSHTQVVDDVRRELAELYLADPDLPIGEIVERTGFSHVAAFYRAFRRWSGGQTPGSFRTQLRERAQRSLCDLRQRPRHELSG